MNEEESEKEEEGGGGGEVQSDMCGDRQSIDEAWTC